MKNDELLRKILVDIMSIETGGGKNMTFTEADGTVSHAGFNQKIVDAHRKKKGLSPKNASDLTFGEQFELFKDEFVNVNGIKNVPEQYLPIVLDRAFNSGAGNAAKVFQRTVGAKEDGIIGEKTLKKLEAFEPQDFVNKYSDNFIDFLGDIPYKQGIENRINSVRERELAKINPLTE